MDVLTAAILGFVQGLTEFLPISSSGHLVVFQRLFGFKEPQLMFDVIVHTGTLVAVVVFVRQELFGLVRSIFGHNWLTLSGYSQAWRSDAYFRLLMLMVIGSIPTALVGLGFKDVLTGLFASTTAVGLALMGTGLLLLASKFAPAGDREYDRIGWGRALFIGLIQGLAIIPGVSRSGSTITAGLFVGIERVAAARFSFLLSLPAVMGALLLELLDGSGSAIPVIPAAIGFVVAAVSGYVALTWLMRLVVLGRFYLFAPYCLILGLATWLFLG